MTRQLGEQVRKDQEVGSTFPNAHIAGMMIFWFIMEWCSSAPEIQ
jgi:hypothetical protein